MMANVNISDEYMNVLIPSAACKMADRRGHLPSNYLYLIGVSYARNEDIPSQTVRLNQTSPVRRLLRTEFDWLEC